MKIGSKHSERTKRNMSLAHMGHKTSKKTREKISRSLTGRVRPEEVRRKLSITHKRLGTKPPVWNPKGGKLPISKQQKKLLRILGPNWLPEVKVLTGTKGRGYGYFKIDVACKKLMIGIECDGVSHFSDKAKDRDKRKNEELKKLGWRIIRLRNNSITKMKNTEIMRLI